MASLVVFFVCAWHLQRLLPLQGVMRFWGVVGYVSAGSLVALVVGYWFRALCIVLFFLRVLFLLLHCSSPLGILVLRSALLARCRCPIWRLVWVVAVTRQRSWLSWHVCQR